MASELAPILVDGREPSRRDRRHLISPLANRFPCGDGRWIVLNMPEVHWWPRFCTALGRDDLLGDPRFTTVKDRFDHMPDLIDALDATFATRSLAEWGEVFDAAGLIWGPASTVNELIDDPQAAAVGLFPELEVAGERFRTVGGPISFGGHRPGPAGPAPGVGEHTVQVLVAAGVPATEIEELVAQGVVGVPSPAVTTDAGPARH
jgi:crotonobetainyl-CoA:carnitine CoA-transferase CaiB-like acyl-CoA transferase